MRITNILCLVRDVIESRDQEPYIAYKLKPLLESQPFKVHHFENKDVYLGKALTKLHRENSL